ncbi:MAG: ABC transporter substrate-binding protein [Candidatus Bipolaricaulota bacterium]|nr:ABC transporter substrate-binding protein [Candidatus Bipolaricaulota bacterium]MBS3791874.1 ABC transporter substrate-binding protein [Candidatus Bipolaricaulota bacterium]
MSKKLIVALVAFSLVISTGLFVFGQTEITFWHAMHREHKEALEHITAQFEETNPGIKVKLVDQGGYGELSQKLTTSAAAGKLPTASQQYEDWTIQYVNAELVKGLEGVVSQETIDNLPEALVDSCTFHDKMYTLPFNKSAMVLFYNTDLIEEPPKTWDELLAMTKELTVDKDGDGEMDQYGFGLRPTPELFSLFHQQAGGSFLSDDKSELLIDSEQGVRALNFLADLRENSLYQTDYLSGPFGSGKVAMYIGSSAGAPYVASASEGNHGWDTAALPEGPANGDSMIQGTNVGVFKVGNSEDEIEAGLEYIQFLTKDQWTIYWAEKTGYIPVTLSALNSDDWQSFLDENPKRRASTQMMKEGFVYPHHPDWYTVRNIFGNILEKTMLGKGEPEGLLEEGADKFEEKYAN